MTNYKSLHNIEALISQLESERIPFHRLKNEPIIRIPTHLGNHEGVLYIRWESMSTVIQFILILPFIVPQEQIKNMTILINRINFNIPILGFVLDEKNGVLSFRTQAFLDLNQSISQRKIGALISITVNTVKKFQKQLEAVAIKQTKDRTKSLFDFE